MACKHEGGTDPCEQYASSGSCKVYQREKARLRWAANPEKMREISRQRHAENPEKKRDRDRRRYAANPEKGREKSRRWRLEHPGYRQLLMYGLSLEDRRVWYAALKGICPACRKPMTFDEFVVDHDHDTKKNRGLLHNRCNKLLHRGLGPAFFRSLADYLERQGIGDDGKPKYQMIA